MENFHLTWQNLDTAFRDGNTSKCLKTCVPSQNPPLPMPGTPAPPPVRGEKPCVECASGFTFPQRLNKQDEGMPCCTSGQDSYRSAWPWNWGGGEEVLGPALSPQLWQDLYAVKNRAVTGFAYDPNVNPFVL